MREFLSRVSSRELSEWEAFYRIEQQEAEESRKRMELEMKARQGVKARKQRVR